MKIRKGFVTNSSSTNFGTIVLTSLGGAALASLLSMTEGDEGENKENQNLIVRLVILPPEPMLSTGTKYEIKAKVMVLIESEGEFKTDNAATEAISLSARAENNCADFSEEPYMEPDTAGAMMKVFPFTVTDDEKKLDALAQEYSITADISGSYQGKGMRRTLQFKVPVFKIVPNNVVFLSESQEEQDITISVNLPRAEFVYDFKSCGMLDSSSVQTDGESTSVTLTLTESMGDENNFFEPYVCKIIKEFEIKAITDLGTLRKKFTATFLREGILVPPPAHLKQPLELLCFTEAEKQKRIDEAKILPIKVMLYDEEHKDLKADIDLANDLHFEFRLKDNYTDFDEDEAKKAIVSADLISELHPEDGKATEMKPYATYRLYANKAAFCATEKIDVVAAVSCAKDGIKEVSIATLLKPLADYRSMIKWFIELPGGSMISKYVKIGDVNIANSAFDFIGDSVFKLSAIIAAGYMGSSKENHYQDGEWNAFRGKYIALRDESMPVRIGEFKKIQSLYHELCHAIEHMNGSYGGSDGEKRAYFIQYLTDAVKMGCDFEKNLSAEEIKKQVSLFIAKYGEVFFNANNVQPITYYNDFPSWFHVETPSQHIIMDKFANFDVYCEKNSLSDSYKEMVAAEFKKQYFPGDIYGFFDEKGGPFSGAVWKFVWGKGCIINATVTLGQYTFKEQSRKWLGSNKLELEFVFDVTSPDHKTDVLKAHLSAGEFNNVDYQYPKVDHFEILWSTTGRIADSIIGKHLNEKHELIKSNRK